MCSNFKKIQARNDSRFILHAMARFHSAYVPSHSFLESCGKAFPLFQKIQDYRLESTRGSDKPDDVSLVGAGWLEGFAGLHLHRPRLLFRAKPLSGPFWTKLRFGELHVLRDVLRFNFFFTFIVFFSIRSTCGFFVTSEGRLSILFVLRLLRLFFSMADVFAALAELKWFAPGCSLSTFHKAESVSIIKPFQKAKLWA